MDQNDLSWGPVSGASDPDFQSPEGQIFHDPFQAGRKDRQRKSGVAIRWHDDRRSGDPSRQILQNIKKGISPQSVAEMREAKAAADQVERDRAEAERRDNFTFGEAADHFLEWSKNNKKSYRDDRNRYRKHLEGRFGKIPIRDLSPFHLEKLKSSLKKKELAPATVGQCLQLVRGIFNKSRAWGMHECEFPAVKFPKVSNHRVAFLTRGQADDLLSAVKKRSIRLWCQCVLGLYAGLRFGEIAGLELQDIDFEGGVIHIRDAKGEDRVAYITEPIEQMFAEWWTFSDKKPGLVFPTDKNGRQVNVSSTFARILKDLGINKGITDPRQKIVFHSLRHSFASWLVMGGENLYTVMALMGHKDITTTMKYSHFCRHYDRCLAEAARIGAKSLPCHQCQFRNDTGGERPPDSGVYHLGT